MSNFRLVTVATHMTPELERFIESAEFYGYDHTILGLGREWVGGEANNGRLVFPGGGMKVNLLKDYLKTLVNDDDVILFTDSYDVVFNDTPEELLKRWEKKGKGLLFTAEKTCWPDTNLEGDYPDSPYDYKYLNSGGFVGTVGDLKVLTETMCKDSDDDQLYYTLKFLNNEGIKLDYTIDIFQTLNSSFDDVQVIEGKVFNKVTKTNPIVIHANGGVGPRTYLNGLYNNMEKPKQLLKEWEGTERVKLQLFFTFKHSNPNIIMDSIEYLSYPKELMDVVIYNNHTENQWSIDNFVKNNGKKYNSIQTYFDTQDWLYDIRRHSLIDGEKYDGDYVLQVEANQKINNKDTIQILIEENKDIIAPMINEEQTLNSNYWVAIDNNGYFEEGEDYFPIRSYDKKGTFVVPFIKGVVLFKTDYLKQEAFKKMYSDEDIRYYEDDHDVIFCNVMRESNLLMYVTNKRYFGKYFD
jgi:hypothetical protein